MMRGIESLGKNSRISTVTVMRLSQDRPITITLVDTAERVAAVLPRIDEMVNGGLVIAEDVHVRRYSGAGGPGAAGL